jgi:hypothetical protein
MIDLRFKCQPETENVYGHDLPTPNPRVIYGIALLLAFQDNDVHCGIEKTNR